MRLAAVREYATIWLVACVGVVLSLLGFGMLRGQLEAHESLEFEWVAHNRYRALESAVSRGLEAVRSLADLMLVGSDRGPEGFRIAGRSLLGRTRGMVAVYWAPAVSSSLRPGWELGDGQRPRTPILERSPRGDVKPARTRDAYFPVELQEGLESGPFPSGLDLASETVVAEALDRAESTGRTAVSARLRFDRGSGPTSAFVAVHPVFGGTDDGELGDLAVSTGDRRPLVGVVMGLFDLPMLAKAAIDPLEPRGVDCLIRDESAEPGNRFLEFYASRLGPPPGSFDEASWRGDARRLASATFFAADREWSVTSALTSRFRSAEAFEEGPWVALTASLFLTLLLTSYLVRSRQAMLQRIEMERTLRDREEIFWQMTETVSEVFWATTPDRGEFLYISPGFEEMWGLSCEALYRDPGVYERLVLAEDRSSITSALDRMRRDKTPVQAIFRLRREDGSIRWIRDRGFPVLDEAGEISRVVGFAEDITEERLAREALQTSEKRLREIFNQSPDVMLTVDREGRVLFINRSTPELPADLAIGRGSEILVPDEMHGTYSSALEAVFASGEIEHFDFRKEDGTSWEIRVVPLVRGETVETAMVIVTDVTTNRELQAQAARNTRLASVGVLAAGVAHEINNPNNAIRFDASVLARAWKDIEPVLEDYFEENGDFALGGLPFAEARTTLPELLSQIGTNSERIQRIVENLKHLSRKNPRDLFSSVDVRTTLEAAAAILRRQTNELTDHFELDVPESLPAVRGSSQQLEQVFINVILNALQALPDRHRGVYVEARPDVGEGLVRIRVRDEGEGISSEHLDALTEPFFSTRDDVGGTGLGLSISKSIVDRHGGRITFDSQPGAGTTVEIALPIVDTGTT